MTMGVALFRFEAPLWLALLALPLLVLWLGARGAAARALFTGTLSQWRALPRRDPRRERRRRRLPIALVLLVLGLCAGVLALARPVEVEAAAPRRWTIVVDRSPGLFLSDSATTRLERALGPVREWIEREVRAEDTLEWLASDLAAPIESRRVPAELSAPPSWPQEAPDWARHDRAGALWVSTRFELPPRWAGFSASGGPAQPGPVARQGGARLDWDGTALVRVEDAYAAGQGAVAIDPELPAPLRELAGLWAAQHALAVHERGDGGECLALVRAAPPARTSDVRERELGRDGWSARATLGAALVSEPGEREWLGADGPAVLVRGGRVRTNLAALGEPGGDPAAFAVSWGALLDALRLEPPGCVPLAARVAQGEPGWRAPREPDGVQRSQEQPLAWIAALAAALLVLCAWAWRAPVAE